MRWDTVSLEHIRSESTNTDWFWLQPNQWFFLHPYPLYLSVTLVCAALSSPFHRRASMLDFYFDHSEERPLEAFEDIFASYENKK